MRSPIPAWCYESGVRGIPRTDTTLAMPTGMIIGCALEVHRTLGPGFVVENVMVEIKARSQVASEDHIGASAHSFVSFALSDLRASKLLFITILSVYWMNEELSCPKISPTN